jgi:hypothetical protein
MIEEVWKDVEGYEGLYQISSKGQVKRVERYYIQFNGLTGNTNTKLLSEMIMKQFEDKDGYLRIQLIKDGNRKKHFVHRLVALNFIPNPENKPEVNHKDGVKDNNKLSNLEWNTTSENQRHAIANKLYVTAKGEGSGTSKLKEVQVREIHRLWKYGGITQEDLSDIFGVKSGTISRIVNGIRWRHIYNELHGITDE